MTEKRGKSQARMQVQAKPSNRQNERNLTKTINNICENNQIIKTEK